MKQLEIELLRGRGYPQGDDDADACTTQVRVCVYDAEKTHTLAEPQLSSVQRKSNAPFYKDKIVFDVAREVARATVVLHVLELSRQRTPLAILHAEAPVSLDVAYAKREVCVVLTAHDPVAQSGVTSEAHVTAHTHAHDASNGSAAAATLTMRVAVRLPTVNAASNQAAVDVDVGDDVALNGDCALVPLHGQYVWLSLSSDKRWLDAFAHALLRAWRARAPLPQFSSHAAASNGNSNGDSTRATFLTVAPAAAAAAAVAGGAGLEATAASTTAMSTMTSVKRDGVCAPDAHSVRGSTASSPSGAATTATVTPNRSVGGAAAITSARRNGRSSVNGNAGDGGAAVSPSLLSASVGGGGGAGAVRTIGDVVMQRWSCRRTYQVLTRLRLTAEKYARGDASLTLAPEEESAYRLEKKSRAVLLHSLCKVALDADERGVLRDALDHAWVLFAVGIDCGGAANGGGAVDTQVQHQQQQQQQQQRRVLSYDVRRRVHETAFEDDDAVLLQASLLHFTVPSLPYETCQLIAEEDYRAAPLALLPAGSSFDSGEGSATTAQRHFTYVVVLFLGALAETLTSVELVRMLRVYKPAIADAQRRIDAGAKDGIKARLAASGRTGSAHPHLGSGIHISHLDKLGRRKNAVQFA